MSSRHRSSRRRTYGRRQHEVRERRSRSVDWQLDPIEFAQADAEVSAESRYRDPFDSRVIWAMER